MTTERNKEELALIALLYSGDVASLPPAELRRRFDDGATPLAMLGGEADALLPTDTTSELTNAQHQLDIWNAEGITILTPFSTNYPSQLRSVFDYPLVLFARGEVVNDRLSAAIVGSREVSPAGLGFAGELAGMLASDGITVVSGLARGVDGAAHRAALDAGGRTVAVLGNGLRTVYPAEHRALQAQIADTGLLVSQFRPESRPTRQTFPQRNITMSAYSSVTVIAEASEKSGTRIQAHAAIKHARPLVLTAQVVRDTTWGQHFAGGGYDVAVAGDAQEARVAVREILERSSRAAGWLIGA